MERNIKLINMINMRIIEYVLSLLNTLPIPYTSMPRTLARFFLKQQMLDVKHTHVQARARFE